MGSTPRIQNSSKRKHIHKILLLPLEWSEWSYLTIHIITKLFTKRLSGIISQPKPARLRRNAGGSLRWNSHRRDTNSPAVRLSICNLTMVVEGSSLKMVFVSSAAVVTEEGFPVAAAMAEVERYYRRFHTSLGRLWQALGFHQASLDSSRWPELWHKQ